MTSLYGSEIGVISQIANAVSKCFYLFKQIGMLRDVLGRRARRF
jgi:hypothetical protein